MLDSGSGVATAILPQVCFDGSGSVVCRTRLVPSTSTLPLITATNADNVRFAGLTVSGSLSVGIRVLGGSAIAVEGCTLHNLGQGVAVADDGLGRASARVSLRGSDVGFTAGGATSWAGGNRTTLQPSGHLVENSVLHDFGLWVYTYNPGVSVEGGVGVVVRKNVFHSSYHVAILFSGNNHVFELNEFHHVTTISYDAGAIYAGRDLTCRGTVIRHNLFRDLDDGSGTGPSPCTPLPPAVRVACGVWRVACGVWRVAFDV